MKKARGADATREDSRVQHASGLAGNGASRQGQVRKAGTPECWAALAALCLWSLQVIPVVNPEQSWHTRAPNKRETPPSLVPTTAGLARESLVHGEVVHAGIANLRLERKG